jgi:methionyl-tRNA formyltransferase
MINRVLVLGNRKLSIDVVDFLHSEGVQILVILNPSDQGNDESNNLSLKKWIKNKKIATLQPKNLQNEETAIQIKTFAPDFAISCSYQLKIPKSIIDIPPKGFANFHYADLPKNRGCLPVINSLFDATGKLTVTMHKIIPELDAGAIILKTSFSIDSSTTAEEGYKLCSIAALKLFEEFWSSFCLSGLFDSTPQLDSEASYNKLIFPNNRWISWDMPAQKVSHFINCLTYYPHPSARTLSKYKGNHIEIGILGPSIIQKEISSVTPGEVMFLEGTTCISCDDYAISFKNVTINNTILSREKAHEILGKRLFNNEQLCEVNI